MSDRLDIVIFGVTGFTGLRTIPYVTKIIKDHRLTLTWGVAGRSQSKIKQSLKELQNKTGENYDNIPIIIADVQDENSLINMTSKAKVIINAAGPYLLTGEPVVKACLETCTHHVDVSGEPLFMEKMQLTYHDDAKSKGVYIISACGMDSIPADLGVVFLKNNFEGSLNSVETFMYSKIENVQLGGPTMNNGTYFTIVHTMANFTKTEAQRKLLFKTELPSLLPNLGRAMVHKSSVVNKWCLPMSEPDQSVVNRSQRYFYELYNERPIQVNCYIGFESLCYLLLTVFFGFWIVLFSQFAFTRKLLLKHPKFFSYGVFSNEAPSDERLEATIFNLKLRGKGWSEKLDNPLAQSDSPPNKEIVAKVSGRNPAYGIACAGLALSAIMILTESNHMPDRGGVYPPGVAFAKTSIIEKLQENGVNFEIVQS